LYDVATEHRGRFLRVQVKCTIFHRGNSYKCHLDSNGVPYSPRDLDFIAALVIPTDTWYILPIRATNGQPDILLTPQSHRAKYEKYTPKERKNAAHSASCGWRQRRSQPRRACILSSRTGEECHGP
jgi:hypothetical protein